MLTTRTLKPFAKNYRLYLKAHSPRDPEDPEGEDFLELFWSLPLEIVKQIPQTGSHCQICRYTTEKESRDCYCRVCTLFLIVFLHKIISTNYIQVMVWLIQILFQRKFQIWGQLPIYDVHVFERGMDLYVSISHI